VVWVFLCTGVWLTCNYIKHILNSVVNVKCVCNQYFNYKMCRYCGCRRCIPVLTQRTESSSKRSIKSCRCGNASHVSRLLLVCFLFRCLWLSDTLSVTLCWTFLSFDFTWLHANFHIELFLCSVAKMKSCLCWS